MFDAGFFVFFHGSCCAKDLCYFIIEYEKGLEHTFRYMISVFSLSVSFFIVFPLGSCFILMVRVILRYSLCFVDVTITPLIESDVTL